MAESSLSPVNWHWSKVPTYPRCPKKTTCFLGGQGPFWSSNGLGMIISHSKKDSKKKQTSFCSWNMKRGPKLYYKHQVPSVHATYLQERTQHQHLKIIWSNHPATSNGRHLFQLSFQSSASHVQQVKNPSEHVSCINNGLMHPVVDPWNQCSRTTV